MLQCVAVCCSVLQCVAVCCSVLQCAAVCCSMLQCVAVCCSVLQCVAACCSVLQCVAVCCSVLQCVALCCSVLPCSVTDSTRYQTTFEFNGIYILFIHFWVFWDSLEQPFPATGQNIEREKTRQTLYDTVSCRLSALLVLFYVCRALLPKSNSVFYNEGWLQ